MYGYQSAILSLAVDDTSAQLNSNDVDFLCSSILLDTLKDNFSFSSDVFDDCCHSPVVEGCATVAYATSPNQITAISTNFVNREVMDLSNRLEEQPTVNQTRNRKRKIT